MTEHPDKPGWHPRTAAFRAPDGTYLTTRLTVDGLAVASERITHEGTVYRIRNASWAYIGNEGLPCVVLDVEPETGS